MRIKKTSQTTTLPAQVVNTYSDSTEDAYACDYQNKAFGGVVLWEHSNPSTAGSWSGSSLPLSQNISNFSYYEVIYKYTITEYGKCVQSTGKIPTSELARLIDISGGVPNFRNVTALSGTTITFDDCKYYNSYLSTQTTNYNSSCVPIQIIGYK